MSAPQTQSKTGSKRTATPSTQPPANLNEKGKVKARPTDPPEETPIENEDEEELVDDEDDEDSADDESTTSPPVSHRHKRPKSSVDSESDTFPPESSEGDAEELEEGEESTDVEAGKFLSPKNREMWNNLVKALTTLRETEVAVLVLKDFARTSVEEFSRNILRKCQGFIIAKKAMGCIPSNVSRLDLSMIFLTEDHATAISQLMEMRIDDPEEDIFEESLTLKVVRDDKVKQVDKADEFELWTQDPRIFLAAIDWTAQKHAPTDDNKRATSSVAMVKHNICCIKVRFWSGENLAPITEWTGLIKKLMMDYPDALKKVDDATFILAWKTDMCDNCFDPNDLRSNLPVKELATLVRADPKVVNLRTFIKQTLYHANSIVKTVRDSIRVGCTPPKDLSGPIPRRVYTSPMFPKEAPATLEPPHPEETTTVPGAKSTGRPQQAEHCSGCGRDGHTGKACFLKKHCNFNGTGGPWFKSRFAPAFARHGHTVLPKEYCIDHLGNFVAYSMPPGAPNASDSSKGRRGGGRGASSDRSTFSGRGKLAAIVEKDESPDEVEVLEDTLILTQLLFHDRSRWQSIITLVDSGARDNNYISEELVRKLKLEREVVKVRTQVCPVGSACSIVNERVLINIKIKSELTNKPYTFSTYAYIYKGLSDQDEFDLIIGKPCMRKHRIVALLPYSFGLDDEAILSMTESIKDRAVVNSSVNGSTERSSEQVVPHPNAGASLPVTTSRVPHSNAGTSVSSNFAKPHSNAGSAISLTARTASHPNAEAEEQNVPGTAGGTENKSLERRVKPIKLTNLSQRDGGQEISAATETHTYPPFESITRGCSCDDDTFRPTTHTPINSRHQDTMLHELRVLPDKEEQMPPSATVDTCEPDGEQVICGCCSCEPVARTKTHDDAVLPLPLHGAEHRPDEKSRDPLTPTSPTFLNCSLARVTNGTVRRVSHIEEDLTDKEDDDDYEHIVPPGLDTNEMLLSEKGSSLEEEKSPLPQMVSPNEELNVKILALCKKYEHIFSRTIKPQPAKIAPLVLEIDKKKWFNGRHSQAAREMSGEKQQDVLRQVSLMEASQLIRQSQQALSWSQVLLVKKPSGAWRFCVDYRELNDCLVALGWRIPNIKQLLERLGTRKAKYFAVVDLTQGYHQISLAEACRQYAAFITPSGLYEPNRVWMGLKTAGSYFQQQISHVVLLGLIFQICEVYIDDVIIHGETEEEFLANLAKVFERFAKYGIFLNPDKCVLGVNEIEYVGHVVGKDGVKMSREKISKVLNFPRPERLKELRSFLGLVNYFRDHVARYATIVGPLYKILNELTVKRQLKWTEEAHNAFIAIQKAIDECPTLFFVNEEAPITLHTDASEYGIGGYLFQTIDNQQQPIRFISKAFTRPQLAWSTFAKEAYAIIYCIKKLDYLLRDSTFEVQTDHRNLLFLKESSDAKVVRWNMALADYNFTTKYIVGETNVVADAMSRFLPNPKEGLRNAITSTTCEVQRANLMTILQNIDLPDDKHELITKFHNSQVGHFGFEHTIRKLQEYGHKWKYMRSHVKKFLRECPMCQKMNPTVYAVSAIRFTSAAYEPFSRLSLDTIGPLPESTEGYRFILVVIDCFTRIIELYPCRTPEADEAAHHLVDFLSRYGLPDQILSDRGTQFVNSIFTTLVQRIDSEHVRSLANSKQETGIVERANKEVLRFLIPLVYLQKNLESWVSNIPLVRRIYITHPHDSTGVAPATLLYGSMVQLERGIFPDARLPEEMPSATPPRGLDSTWIDKMRETQLALLEVAQKHQRELDSENLADRTQRSQAITEFPIGSYVLALYKDQHSRGKGRPKHKLLTVKQGPFRVISREDNTYTVQNLAHDNMYEFHVTDLEPFVYNPNFTDPVEVSLGDNQEFEVEQILDHEKRRDPTGAIKREQLVLKVRWAGYSAEHDSWEPSGNLVHLPLVRDYLNANRLRSYIVKSLKDSPEKNPKPRNKRQKR
jgi:hypothetical protein